MSNNDVVLVAMPWASLHRTPIQLGVLQTAVDRAGFSIGARSFNLAAMQHFYTATINLDSNERITVADYKAVAEDFYVVGMGEWIFAVPPYRDYTNEADEKYLAYVRSKSVPEEIIAKALQMRALVPGFLELCLEDILITSPRIVGFTSCFGQNIPSLVLSKMIKQHNPSVHIVFGGANCEGPMGAALHRTFGWIDTVVRGEAEGVLPELIRDVLSSNSVRPQPGLCYRVGGQSIVSDDTAGTSLRMDDVPIPNYDEYFERLQKCRFYPEIIPKVKVLFESSRGCWWGEKSHCTFCGLNGSTMKFRSKSASRVAAEIYSLASKYKQIHFEAVDNIFDMKYLNELLPILKTYRSAGLDFSFFYETKSNLKKEQLRMMSDVGIRSIQPGIESLSTTLLKLMKKGVTALQNIRLLKWAQLFGIDVQWNILYGFPGEPIDEYEMMADIMQSLTHLRPPGLSRVVIERFSPYHRNPFEFGLTEIKPDSFYQFLYDTDEATLDDMAYDFSHKYQNGHDPACCLAKISGVVQDWQESYKTKSSSLTYERGPEFLIISDRRSNLEEADYYLNERESQVYVCCDSGATPVSISRFLQSKGCDLSTGEVTGFLESLLDARLVYKEGNHYLALAIPLRPNADNIGFEANDEVSAQVLVQVGPQRS